MNNSITIKKRDYIFITLGIITIFLIWLFASLIINNEIALPSIGKVFIALKNLSLTGNTYIILLYTLLRIIISLILGILFGIVLGVLSAFYDWFYYFISPFIKIMRALPIASIILIILILFGYRGFGDLTFSPIIVTLLLVIPLVFEAVYRGIKNIDVDLINVGRLYTKNKFDMAKRVYIPLIRNELSIAIVQSVGLSFKAMVMAEYVSQTQTSIGYSLLNAKANLDYNYVFAWTIILIIISILIEVLSKQLIKNKR